MRVSDTGFWYGSGVETHHVHSKELAEWLCNYLSDCKYSQIYDFGCGMGFYLEHLKKNGFNFLQGFEGDPVDNRFFQNVIKQDLATPFSVEKAGTCMCFEVAEHIPSKYQDIFLKNITDACEDKIIMSWAIRGQAGYGHVNCLDNDEVISIMNGLGFSYLKKESEDARSINFTNADWFKNTLFVFKRK